MQKLRMSLFVATILITATGQSIRAKADLIYDFSAGQFGNITFTTATFIPANTNPVPIVQFIAGSLAPPGLTTTQNSNYLFQNAISSLGTNSTYQFNFNSLPLSTGTFIPFQTVVGRTGVNGSLTITQRAVVPEPATLAVLGSAFAGLAALRARRCFRAA